MKSAPPVLYCTPHCLYRDLNDKRPGASSENNFIFKKKIIKIKREKRKTDLMGGFGSTS